MSGATERVLPFKSASENLNASGLPIISDREHFFRALNSESAFDYISARSGRMEFEGEDGIGGMNATTMLHALASKDLKKWMPWVARDKEITELFDKYIPCENVKRAVKAHLDRRGFDPMR